MKPNSCLGCERLKRREEPARAIRVCPAYPAPGDPLPMHLFTALLTVPAPAWANVAAAQDTTRSRQATTSPTQTHDRRTLRSSDEKTRALRENIARDTTSGMQRSDWMGREGYRRGDTTYSAQRYDSTGHQGRGQMREHADLQQLSTLRGAAFDSSFANAMVEGHNKAIGMLEQ